MAKRKFGKSFRVMEIIRSVKGETLKGIISIALFLLSILLLLAVFGKAGVGGTYLFKALWYLFGIGYYLLPIALIFLAIGIVKSFNQAAITVTKIVGGFLFFFSGIGFIDLVMPNRGGAIGELVSTPILKLFDVYVAFAILLGLFTISLFIILDTNLFGLVKKLFEKKEGEDEDEEIEVEEPEVEDKEPEEKEEEPEEEKKETEDAGGFSFFKKKKPAVAFIPNLLPNKPYTPPPLSLLSGDRGKPGTGDIKANANIIKRTLQNFGIIVEMDEISIGPSVTRYALKPAEGVKLSRIVGLQNNLELALAAHPVRIEAPIPGKSLVGIEVPNTAKTTVGLGTLLSAVEFASSEKALMVAFGKGITGLTTIANLAKAPHLLIAGTTGSGKSVTIHALINSLIFRNSPEQLKFIMVDPKRVELTLYNGIPHLLTPVITDAKKTIIALKWLAKEMERRYDILEKSSVRDIESYHSTVLKPALEKGIPEVNDEDEASETVIPDTMPYIMVVIDELADIMQAYPRELEAAIVRLAQMSRAVGIHLILSTQRPSVNVITGLIKANIPSRVALQVASQIDSRTILDMPGAEKLLGAGDMLYMSGDMSKPIRLQSAFISEEEVKKVVSFLKKNYSDSLQELDFSQEQNTNAIFESSFDDDGEEDNDDLYEEARELVIHAGKASTSYLQRRLRVGYARAARLVDMLEERGVIGPADGAKPREVIDGKRSDGGNELP